MANVADGVVPMMTHLFITTFVHAFGLEHLHTVGPFIQRVVHGTVWLQDFTWQYTLVELMVVYIKALDDRRTGNTMANTWQSGSQDTFAKSAEKAAIQCWGPSFVFFFVPTGGTQRPMQLPQLPQPLQPPPPPLLPPGSLDRASSKWNGKWTTGAKPCLTFNNGSDAHPKACLLADGTCRFDHVCDHFIEGGH